MGGASPLYVRLCGYLLTMNPSDLTTWLPDLAREHGLADVGVARVAPMDPQPLQTWLEQGYGAGMTYLQRHLPLRADLTRVLPGARSVICALVPYAGPDARDAAVGAVACFARGPDYHDIVRDRLQQLWAEIARRYPEALGRVFVDSGPLPERELARRAGLGRLGWNSCLISPLWGSRLVLGEILTTLPLVPTPPLEGGCAGCGACVRACPAGALVRPGVVDARRCIAYLTIEHAGAIPPPLRPLIGTRLFGCDTCQDVCPHNRDLPAAPHPLPHDPALCRLDPVELLSLPAEDFQRRFRRTPLHRARRAGLLRNACIVLGNAPDPRAFPLLRQAALDPDPVISAHAVWAVEREKGEG